VLEGGVMNLIKFTKINAMQIKFHVPETLSEITLKQYQDFILLDKEMEEDAYLMAIAKIFVRGDLVHIEKLPLKKLNEIFETITNLFATEKNKFTNIIKIDGVEYGLVPNLDELSIGEVADIEEYFKQGYEKNLHNILAILFRPITQKFGKLYNIETYNGTQERPALFQEHFPCDILQGVLVFFSTLENDFLNHTLSYLLNQEESKNFKQAVQ